MRALMVVVVLGGMSIGCATITAGAGAPVSPLDRFGTFRHAVEYELMPRVRGEACAGAVVHDSESARTIDKAWIGNAYLYEKAKVIALDATKEADGLIEIRSSFQLGTDGNECVVITGRPYRVVSMRATSVAMPEPKPVKDTTGVMAPTPEAGF